MAISTSEGSNFELHNGAFFSKKSLKAKDLSDLISGLTHWSLASTSALWLVS